MRQDAHHHSHGLPTLTTTHVAASSGCPGALSLERKAQQRDRGACHLHAAMRVGLVFSSQFRKNLHQGLWVNLARRRRCQIGQSNFMASPGQPLKHLQRPKLIDGGIDPQGQKACNICIYIYMCFQSHWAVPSHSKLTIPQTTHNKPLTNPVPTQNQPWVT